MKGRLPHNKLSSFQIIIFGFLGLIILGAGILMLPLCSNAHQWTDIETALFTSTSAVCVTGLVMVDTASYWSIYGQIVILILIQVGGLGIVTIAAFIASVSGRKISLLQRSLLQDSISAHQIGGIVRLTRFIFKIAFFTELIGAISLMPFFCLRFGIQGIFLSIFHSISAFCNAGFDILGDKTGQFSSLSAFSCELSLIIPTCILIIFGGIGFLTWEDMQEHKLKIKRYRMQSKVILLSSVVLIIVPFSLLYLFEFSDFAFKERFYLSLFSAVTPRTAGFNTADYSKLSGGALLLTASLMVIGGSPGSTAGGMKTTTAAVLFSNAAAVFRKKKSARMFGRRIEDGTVKDAATLLITYLLLVLSGAFAISYIDGIAIDKCIFETASAIGTVGLTTGITPELGTLSHFILIALMFFGRVGGLTLIYAAINSNQSDISQYPMEKITVG